MASSRGYSGFVLQGNLKSNLATLPIKQNAAIRASAHFAAPHAEAFMKQTAPWTDRTGNARNGLRASVIEEGEGVAIVLYHSVPYGVFLEVRWGGRYAVIPAAMAFTGDLWKKTLKTLLFA